LSAAAHGQIIEADVAVEDGGTATSPGDASETGAAVSAPVPDTQVDTRIRELDAMSLEELLDTPVVTATGSEEKRSLAPASVFVVSKDDIARRGYRSVAEALEDVPGLYVINDTVTPALAVRGVSSGLKGGTRIVRVMIDGVQVNFRPELNAYLGLEYIPVEAIERIEIAKGALSALYGANAFLATINVITRRPTYGLHAEVAARVTRYQLPGSYDGSGTVSYADDNFKFLAAATLGRFDRSGLGLQHTFQGQKDVLDPKLFDRYSRDDLSSPLSAFAVGELESRFGTFTLEGGAQHTDAVSQFQVNSLFTQSRVVIDNFWSAAHWTKTWSEHWASQLTLGWSTGAPGHDMRLLLPDSGGSADFAPNYRYQALDAAADVTWSPVSALSVRAGFDLEWDVERVLYYTQTFNAPVTGRQVGDRLDVGIGPDEPRDVTMLTMGGSLQIAATPLPKLLPDLKLTGNVRLDSISQGPVKFPLLPSWRAAVMYQAAQNVTARLVAGRAFQTPSALLTFARPGYGNAGNIVGNLTISGAPLLRPQTVTSIEAGTTAHFFKMLWVEANLYYQEVDDRIDFLRYGTNFRAKNEGSSSNVGLEATVRFARGPVSAYANASVQCTFVDGQQPFVPPAGYPNAFGSVGVDVDVPKTYVRAHAAFRWATSRGAAQGNVFLNNDTFYTLPGYGLVDLVLSTFNVHLLSDTAETRLQIGVKNLLDTRYSESGYGGFDTPVMGRTFFIELRQFFY
jgi:outer membrane receptor protein involved in Fe transport